MVSKILKMKHRFWPAAFVFVMVTSLWPALSGATTLSAARVVTSNAKQQFVFDVSDAVDFKAFTLSKPNRLVLDLKNTQVKTALSQLNVQGTVVSSIRSGYFQPGVVRVVFDLKQPAKWQTRRLASDGRHGQQLVLEFMSSAPVQLSTQSQFKTIPGVAAASYSKTNNTIPNTTPNTTSNTTPNTTPNTNQMTSQAPLSTPAKALVKNTEPTPTVTKVISPVVAAPVLVASASALSLPKPAVLAPPAVKQTPELRPVVSQQPVPAVVAKLPVLASIPAVPASLSQRSRDIIVAIDAGHGGKDPGAIGHQGSKEKDVVLAIARELHKQMSTVKGLKPVLIRDGDYFIHLKNRRDIARNKYNADVFISIHADAFSNKGANGASVFVLSQNGASSTTASYLADRENSADLIDGFDISNANASLSEMILNVAMDGVLAESNNVGHQILKELGSVSRLHKKQVEHAGFMVLKSPDMLSLLVETGFISNPAEEKLLKNQNYQRNLAQAIVKGTHRYFENNPIPGTYYAQKNEQRFAQTSVVKHEEKQSSAQLTVPLTSTSNYKSDKHVVAKGETLSTIASRYRISMSTLKRVNGIHDDQVWVGKVLQIPEA